MVIQVCFPFLTILNVYIIFVDTFLDAGFSPTGEGFVTGSADRSIRIFQTNSSNSGLSIAWTFENKHVLSGTKEMNILLWKAKESEKKLGEHQPRQKASHEYNERIEKQQQNHNPATLKAGTLWIFLKGSSYLVCC
uniref:Uncharacterized protein n=1 Tax=Panagrolaimus davidi TaxID=227884 RepID=A0A914Q9P6_9BILA